MHIPGDHIKKIGKANYITNGTMWFPVGNRTLNSPSILCGAINLNSIDVLTQKKPFVLYDKRKARKVKMPEFEQVVVINTVKLVNSYLSNLFDCYKYMYTTQYSSFGSVLNNHDKVVAEINLYRAKDVLPPEYSCNDCVVFMLKANDTLSTVVFSNIPELLEVDGEEFVNKPQTKDLLRNFLNIVEKGRD